MCKVNDSNEDIDKGTLVLGKEKSRDADNYQYKNPSLQYFKVPRMEPK